MISLGLIARMLAFVAAAGLLASCQDKAKEKRRADLTDLMHGNTPDADIQAAIEHARKTVPEFLAALKEPRDRKQFMVRKAFPATGGKQQILWITGLSFDGTLLHGKVDDNTARPGSGIPKDGSVSFPPSEIADWMYNDGGLAVGGFMLRALKKKMTEEEWAKLTQQIAFKE